MAAAEFTVNNKVHTATKVLPFMANYGKELRMGGDIRRKGKVERMKKVHEEVEAALKKTQKEMKRYMDRNRKETEKWEKGD